MGDSEKFSNNSPDLQDAIRSIEAIGEDSGAIAGEGPDAAEPDGDGEPGGTPPNDDTDGADTTIDGATDPTR